MRKRRLTQLSSDDYTDNKRVPITPDSNPVHGSTKVNFSNKYNQQEGASSVGSNNPIGEVITLSDDDDGVVESKLLKIDSSLREDVAGGELKTIKSEIGGFRSPVVAEECCDEQWSWFEKYGCMIVDDNGFLLGEFRRLDEELYIKITAD